MAAHDTMGGLPHPFRGKSPLQKPRWSHSPASLWTSHANGTPDTPVRRGPRHGARVRVSASLHPFRILPHFTTMSVGGTDAELPGLGERRSRNAASECCHNRRSMLEPAFGLLLMSARRCPHVVHRECPGNGDLRPPITQPLRDDLSSPSVESKTSLETVSMLFDSSIAGFDRGETAVFNGPGLTFGRAPATRSRNLKLPAERLSSMQHL